MHIASGRGARPSTAIPRDDSALYRRLRGADLCGSLRTIR